MRRKGLRRVEFWLPEDHWLFSLPAGRRAEKVRELIELAMNIAQGFDALRQDVVREIATLRDEVVQALRQNPPSASPATRPAGVSGEAAKRFLAAFD